MKNSHTTDERRRDFIKIAAAGAIAPAFIPAINSQALAQEDKNAKPSTNIADALKEPRNVKSMPGVYPGKVVRVNNDKSIKDFAVDYGETFKTLERGILALTGENDINKAWLQFVKPTEKIGLKVNPVAGKDLSTSVELVKALIAQLENAGVPKENIIIWDRREFQLPAAGFTAGNFPGIKITGTERSDKDGGFYDTDGKLYGEKMIDKDVFYFADVEGEYDENTMPYMVNGGKNSYFSKIVTQEIDKIINIPILKNAGNTVTLALKNLAYGSISNTGRLHKQLWSETCAEVCAFPPIRDKTVLNIADGLKGCYNGGPGANPEFFCEYKLLLLATDPVALDRIGHEIVVAKRIEKGLQTKDNPASRKFLELAANLKLGEADVEKIKLETIDMNG